MMRNAQFLIAAALVSLPVAAPSADQWREQISVFKNTGLEGKGNPEAGAAWKLVTSQGPEAILPLLEEMKDASPIAGNWIRSAAAVIHENALRDSPDRVPVTELSAFVKDLSKGAAARELGFELIERGHPGVAAALKEEFLNDPSPELRRQAVATLISRAKAEAASGGDEKAIPLMEEALQAARNVDQIKEIAKWMREKGGKTVDLPRLFGFLTDWKIIGPFDNTGRAGFATPFPPETAKGPPAGDDTYQGKTREVRWLDYSTADEYGMVDFNQPFSPLKEVTAYAYADFQSDVSRDAELRLGCKNAWKVWVNGQFLFGRDEYHRGARIDQYTIPVRLNQGSNHILLKICQDEQTQDWTKEWQFQLRVCDRTGSAILASNRKPSPQPAAAKP